MRKLQTTDIFGACRIIAALGLKEDIKAVALRSKEQHMDQDSAGYELLFSIFEKAVQKKAETEIYKFLGSLFECSAEEVATMDPIECIDKALEVADVEKWKAFFHE